MELNEEVAQRAPILLPVILILGIAFDKQPIQKTSIQC
jgi:hypothetical protein